MKRLFAYIRVSTGRQATGVSLVEQRAIIEQYAVRISAEIVEWFTETRTAAKSGRPEFTRMVGLLRTGKAEGVVIHKLDRGTRNYRDWAEIDELLEQGIDVFIANDNLDLRSRGGRLAADVQVAVAVDYIRNLREEALKGIHGRLKQGILPNAASIGYLDCGKGKPKAIDPIKGPLVARLFEMYATGAYTLRQLTAEAERIGLRSKGGHPLILKVIHGMLRNPFYAGVIRSRRFGLFPGAHTPLVSQAQFDRVQAVLAGKFVRRTRHHDFLFRRLIRCRTCGRSLIGSVAKGRAYYRCSTYQCPTTSLREDGIDSAIRAELRRITLNGDHAAALEQEIVTYFDDDASVREARRAAVTETLAATNARASRLTDLLLDGKIDAPTHDEKRAALLLERRRLEQGLASIEAGEADLKARTLQIVELARTPETLYESAYPSQKRQLLEIVMSNCVANGKTLDLTLREPFATFAKRDNQEICRELYYTPRTSLVEALISLVSDFPLVLANSIQAIKALPDVKPTEAA